VVWFVSGSFDEEVFREPDGFDVGRDPNPHMTFGSGSPHVCLGALKGSFIEIRPLTWCLSRRACRAPKS
jgi:hypothetical protein